MEHLVIRGGHALNGIVEIEGAKNSVLPILASSILIKNGITTLKNVPMISDVFAMVDIMRNLNVKVDVDENTKTLKIDSTGSLHTEADPALVKKIRSSLLVVGSLLSRNGKAKITSLGGCAIGKRATDLHLKGFKALGATIVTEDEYTEITAPHLVGNTIYLDFPSVGATNNIINASVNAKHTTIIENAAKEPEIVDLINFLNKMGAKISGAGTKRIQIDGVTTLHGDEYTVMQDRIEAGTFMIAAAITKGDILIKDAVVEQNFELITKLKEMGITVIKYENGIRVIGSEIAKSVLVSTSPHPGFPTDLQAPITALLMANNVLSVVVENVYENRFQHFIEMKRMNGNFQIHDNVAVINGTTDIRGADVFPSDLRAAAALVLLGLRAEGVTRVFNIHYLDRGYFNFHEKLNKLGAEIHRVVSKMDL